ncbi:MAG TPA: nucleotidyl transferase AbiEii/AbiGii toxin family protein [Caldisericia bacterium]|nr:nucleotidyl transferase AbiEii/AbiGii toxin family protein [Caldisericia bacterium]HRV75674.1 nucleotidyl transferase AbiEii/AbiGii toxin family protein [Caldisericia bacterium]
MHKEIKGKEHSIITKLEDLGKVKGLVDYIYTYYVIDGFIKRLLISKYQHHFTLKGAHLLRIHLGETHRFTRDIDFLVRDTSNSIDNIEKIMKGILSIQTNPTDYITFDIETIKLIEIDQKAKYPGIRISCTAFIGNIRQMLRVDMGFDDIITNKKTCDYRYLLDQNIGSIACYSLEDLMAEKIEAMINLSLVNSRVKDFYDVLLISRSMDINGMLLQNALKNTLANRVTKPFFPEYDDWYIQKYKDQWKGLIEKNNSKNLALDFKKALSHIKDFIEPVLVSIQSNDSITKNWNHKDLSWV